MQLPTETAKKLSTNINVEINNINSSINGGGCGLVALYLYNAFKRNGEENIEVITFSTATQEQYDVIHGYYGDNTTLGQFNYYLAQKYNKNW